MGSPLGGGKSCNAPDEAIAGETRMWGSMTLCRVAVSGVPTL